MPSPKTSPVGHLATPPQSPARVRSEPCQSVEKIIKDKVRKIFPRQHLAVDQTRRSCLKKKQNTSGLPKRVHWAQDDMYIQSSLLPLSGLAHTSPKMQVSAGISVPLSFDMNENWSPAPMASTDSVSPAQEPIQNSTNTMVKSTQRDSVKYSYVSGERSSCHQRDPRGSTQRPGQEIKTEPQFQVKNGPRKSLRRHRNVPPAVPDPPTGTKAQRPPPTPRPARLPTPDLPELGQRPFCACGYQYCSGNHMHTNCPIYDSMEHQRMSP